jgi:hypothetical protein
MNKFPSIESLRHIVKSVHGECSYKGQPFPTIHYTGTVKLHGTNAGIRVTTNKVQPQGRTRILAPTSDNEGFAFWASTRENIFRTIAETLAPDYDDVTIYGEWCGGSIQKKVALVNLPKHFVIFNILANGKYLPVVDIDQFDVTGLNEQGIWFVAQAPHYTVEVDYSNPKVAAEEIEKFTLQVEEVCPWGKLHGVEGTGEGIVWYPTKFPYETSRWFKSKGLKHKKGGKAQKKVDVDPVKVEGLHRLVDEILPDWRLEQGISYLRENNLELSMHSTGQYIKWIHQDILKEEIDVIQVNGFEWKEIVPIVSNRARLFWTDFLNKEAGLD